MLPLADYTLPRVRNIRIAPGVSGWRTPQCAVARRGLFADHPSLLCHSYTPNLLKRVRHTGPPEPCARSRALTATVDGNASVRRGLAADHEMKLGKWAGVRFEVAFLAG